MAQTVSYFLFNQIFVADVGYLAEKIFHGGKWKHIDRLHINIINDIKLTNSNIKYTI